MDKLNAITLLSKLRSTREQSPEARVELQTSIKRHKAVQDLLVSIEKVAFNQD